MTKDSVDLNSPELYCNSNIYEYIILGFGFTVDIELLNTKGQGTSNRLKRPHDAVTTWVDQPLELTKIFNDTNFLGTDADATTSHCLE